MFLGLSAKAHYWSFRDELMLAVFSNLVNEITTFIFSFCNSLGHTAQDSLLYFQIDHLMHVFRWPLFKYVVYSLITM